MAPFDASGDDAAVLVHAVALLAALAVSSSEHGRICREQVNAARLDEQVERFRAEKGREPRSLAELVDAGYLRTPPQLPDGKPLWPDDRDLEPLVLAPGADGKSRVVRRGGASVATPWDCHRTAYLSWALGALVLVAGIAASMRTRRRAFAIVAVFLVGAGAALAQLLDVVGD